MDQGELTGDMEVCYAIKNEKYSASFPFCLFQQDHWVQHMRMQETWQHIWCCDPVAMATAVQRQITPVLISIGSRTAVIYAGPLATEWKAAFQFCVAVLVAAKFNTEQIDYSTFYTDKQKKKKFHWLEQFTYPSL